MNCNLKFVKNIRHKNTNEYFIVKTVDRKPLEINIQYHNWDKTYDRIDRYKFKY